VNVQTNSNSGCTATKPGMTPATAAKPKAEEPDIALYAEARTARVPLRFHMRGGREITGTVHTYGRFSIGVRTTDGRIVLHKHAIDWVEIPGAGLRNVRSGPLASPGASKASLGATPNQQRKEG